MNSEIPKLNRVLVIGVNPNTTKILEEVAKANPTIQFDYATSYEITRINLPNVKLIYMSFYYNPPPVLITNTNVNSFAETACGTGYVGFFYWLRNFLDENIENYDFVITTYPSLSTTDWFHKFRNKRPIFCIDATSSKLESDKLFTKQMLTDIGIPTPKFKNLGLDNIVDKLNHLELPIVIKSNIPVGPLGTWVFNDQSYRITVPNLITRIKRTAKPNPTSIVGVYTEEFVDGPEISAHFLCNGTSWKFVGVARDYKKNYEGDVGTNTNGTGCYSSVDYFTDEIKQYMFSYMNKIMTYLSSMAIYYRGFMYLGVIVNKTTGIPQIIEINTRPGTPEILTILNVTDNSNLLENLYRSATGRELLDIVHKEVYSVAVGLMHSNFPVKGGRRLWSSSKPNITNLPDGLTFYEHCTVFIGQTCCGFVTATDSSKEAASDKIYKYLNTVKMNDYRYRKDIGLLT
jgi:phosphoribosylamine--glycine ligase